MSTEKVLRSYVLCTWAEKVLCIYVYTQGVSNTVENSLREGPRLLTDLVTPDTHTLQLTQKAVAGLAMPRRKGGLTKSGLSGDVCSSKAGMPSTP